MKVSPAVVGAILLTATLVAGTITVAIDQTEEEPYLLPVISQTVYATGDSQEMRFMQGWTKALGRNKTIRAGAKDEPHLWIIITIEWDNEAERLSVMTEGMFMLPDLGGLALKTYSALHVLEARELTRQHHNEVLERTLEVTRKWAGLAVPIFDALAQPCPGTRGQSV
jgi:hypothetical protein